MNCRRRKQCEISELPKLQIPVEREFYFEDAKLTLDEYREEFLYEGLG